MSFLCYVTDVLDTLRQESIAAELGDGSRPPVLEVEGECTYYSPTDDMAMEKVRQLSAQAGFRSGISRSWASVLQSAAVG